MDDLLKTLNIGGHVGECLDIEGKGHVAEELRRSFHNPPSSCKTNDLVSLQTFPNRHWTSSTLAPGKIVEPGRPIEFLLGHGRLHTTETRAHLEACGTSSIPRLECRDRQSGGRLTIQHLWRLSPGGGWAVWGPERPPEDQQKQIPSTRSPPPS